jgi:hypothetical protein
LYYHRLKTKKHRIERWSLIWCACKSLLGLGQNLTYVEVDLPNSSFDSNKVDPLFAYTFYSDRYYNKNVSKQNNDAGYSNQKRKVIGLSGYPEEKESLHLRVHKLV